MKAFGKLIVLLAVAWFVTGGTSPTIAAEATFEKYPNIVDVKLVMEYAKIPKRDDVTIIDARPTARKYDGGHIPTAISIPDRKFNKMTAMLPEDKSQLLIFSSARSATSRRSRRRNWALPTSRSTPPAIPIGSRPATWARSARRMSKS